MKIEWIYCFILYSKSPLKSPFSARDEIPTWHAVQQHMPKSRIYQKMAGGFLWKEYIFIKRESPDDAGGISNEASSKVTDISHCL